MRFQLVKSTLGEYNRGHCGSPNNCRYKGSTTCWVVIDTEDIFTDHIGRKGPIQHIAVNRKFVGEAIVDYCNESNWDGTGDIATIFINYAAENNLWKLVDAFKEV